MVEPAKDSRVRVRSSERSFEMLAEGRPSVEFVLGATAPFKIGDLPDADPLHGMFLVKQLLSMGVLSFA